MGTSWMKRVAVALGALLVLLGVAGALLVATFDADRYKGLAIDWMKRERDRTLAIDGPVGLSVFPRIELTLSKVRLSERGRPADEFLAVDSAGLALQLLPLLRKQLVVDRVQADGVRVKLTRDAKGVRNTDDLAGADAATPSAPAASAPAGQALGFDVSTVKLSNVQVVLRDDLAELAGALTLRALTTGRIGSRSESPVSFDASLAFTQPALKGDLSGTTVLALDLDAGSVRLADAKLAWKGDAFDLRGLDATLAARTFGVDPKREELQLDALKVAVAGRRGGDALKLSLDWPQLKASANALQGSAFSGSVSIAGASALDGTFRSGAPSGSFEQLKLPSLALQWKASSGPRAVSGTLGADLTLRAKQRSAALDALQLQANIVEPSLPPLAVSARGSATASATAAGWTLAGALNDSRFESKGNVALGGALPNVKAQARFDALDLNRLLGPPKPAPAGGPGGDAPVPVDLSPLQAANGQFAFSAGSLAYRQYRVADARLDATLDAGTLRVSRLSGKAWGGSFDASALADAKGGQRVAAKLSAVGVDVGALLKDVADKDLLEGTGRVDADLTSGGATVAALRSRLAGTTSVKLQDGAIKGYNLAKGLRQAKAALTMKQDAVARAKSSEKTDFSELTASARIDGGVARSDDLSLKSPFLRVGGAGTFDIGKGRMDYVAKATVTDTSKGQGGAELAALQGVTVPVRLSGPFDAVDWNIQWSGIAAGAIEQKLKDKLGERLGIKPADKAASQPQQRLQDSLRKLFR